MNIQQKRYKISQLFKRVGWMIVCAFVYIILESTLLEVSINDTCVLMLCTMIIDASLMVMAKQLLQIIVIILTRMDDKRDNFEFRLKIHLIEVISIIIFIYSFHFHWSRSQLWMDIILFILIFLSLLTYNSSYVNVLKMMELNVVKTYIYDTYKDLYDETVRNVKQYNLKEQELFEVRKKYADSDKEVNKAFRDRRSYTVKYTMNPSYQLPCEPEIKRYMGIRGLIYGKGDIYGYQFQIGRYIESLKKAYKDQDQRRKELQARLGDVDNAIRYVRGTESEHEIEKIVGERVNRAEKARSSYKKFHRRRFERKNRKY